MAAKLLAGATGPREHHRGHHRHLPRAGEYPAKAVGPSSHGRVKSRWSLTERARKPRLSAISVYSGSLRRDQCCLFRAISGRWIP